MLEFGNPLLLLGLLAGALPVIAHLLTRARPRMVRFPALRLLREAGGGTQALSRLRTFLLLLLRTIALTALALVFARPFISSGSSAQNGESRHRAVIVIDVSLSMGTNEGGVDLFSRATSQAADLLRSFEDGSQAAVIFAGQRPQAALPALSRNLPVLHQALEDAALTEETCNAQDALSLAARLLEDSGVVYVFSDFQRTNWGAADFAAFPAVQFVLRSVAGSAALAERGYDNIGLTEINLSPAEPLPGEMVRLSCRVFNSSPRQRALQLHLDLEGQARLHTETNLEAFASSTGVFEFSLPQTGIYQGAISIGDDTLQADNTRYFQVNVREGLQAMLISREAGRAGTAANFAGLAFSPPGSSAGIRLLARRDTGVDEAAATLSQAFLVVPPVTLDNGTADILAGRLREGAAVFIFLASEEDRETLAALESAAAGWLALPVEFGKRIDLSHAEAGVSLTPAGRAYLSIFANPAEADLAGLRFASFLSGRALPGKQEDILLTYPDGSPALVACNAGRGKLFILNMQISTQAGTLAGSPLFPALLRELLLAARASGEKNEARPGQAWGISLPVDKAWTIDDLHVNNPDGARVAARLEKEFAASRLLLPLAQRAGIFTVHATAGIVAAGVVNADPRESDLRAMPVRALLDSGGAVTVAGETGELWRAGLSRPLWPGLLGVAALALLLEALLLVLWKKRTQGGAVDRTQRIHKEGLAE